MIGLKVGIIGVAHNAQNGGHGSSAGSKDGAGDEDFGL